MRARWLCLTCQSHPYSLLATVRRKPVAPEPHCASFHGANALRAKAEFRDSALVYLFWQYRLPVDLARLRQAVLRTRFGAAATCGHGLQGIIHRRHGSEPRARVSVGRASIQQTGVASSACRSALAFGIGVFFRRHWHACNARSAEAGVACHSLIYQGNRAAVKLPGRIGCQTPGTLPITVPPQFLPVATVMEVGFAIGN